MIKFGPTIENINLLHDKAKTKRDGVYLFRGLAYRVKDKRFTHYAYNGEILERAGSFNVELGQYSGSSDDAKKALKRLREAGSDDK